MKLYIWSDVAALADYGDGEVVAMAESKEQAIDLACAATDWRWYRTAKASEPRGEAVPGLRAQLERTEPTVHDGPYAWVDRGSG